MKRFLIFSFMVLMLLPLVAHSGTVLPVLFFGPNVYARSAGSPNVFDDSFNAVPGKAFLVVFNGDDEEDSRVDSGSISINGQSLITSADLNDSTDKVVKAVSLTASNTIEVTLDGSNVGGYIIVMVVNGPDAPEFTAGRLILAWTSIANSSEAVNLRLKNASPRFDRNFFVRYFDEDGTLAAVSAKQTLGPHASLNAPAGSFLPQGSTWQTGSIEILFFGRGGARVMGYALHSTSTEETAIPLQPGGTRHFLVAKKSK